MRTSRTLPHPLTMAMTLLTATVLAACGGGGDDSTPQSVSTGTPVTATPTTGTTTTGTTTATNNPLTPACTGCGTVDANTYAGHGVGVWQVANASDAAVEVPLSIAGLTGQDVTLVFTNQTASAQPMPMISLTAASYQYPNLAASMLQLQSATDNAKARISQFNHDGWVAHAGTRGSGARFSMLRVPSQSIVNETKTWYHEDNTARPATLVRQTTASDGTTINFWVENSENDGTKVSPAIVDALVSAFVPAGKIYDMLKSVGGPMWGPHNYSKLLAPTAQPIDIVILNFDNNNTPFGLLGYFYARNALLRDATNPYSNQSVSLYLDSETLYLGGTTGLKSMLMAMAHEGMHMQNYYRRGVVGGASFMLDTWLEEATAMMMEDFASDAIDPSFNNVRDVRFPRYIAYQSGSYNCSLLDWTPFGAGCDSYAVSGSFGGFLDRQLGLTFFKNLLANRSSTDTVAVLDAAIKSVAPSSGFTDQLCRFTATASALMPAATSPMGYGFPPRTEGDFRLPMIDPQAQAPYRTLTQSVPTTLQPYASLPVVRKAVSGVYSESVKLPAGTTLSVVIQ
ncbi:MULTISPECIES: hemagglutinin [unclassified Cupriavidus]|uniref:M30 family zinc metallopeptidase n=2 Tax=Cupriavidus TaxID=106589 RepID=UPI00041D2009|nr:MULTISPECIES: hemagglutinin [unclassified Cupriavidus]MBP0633677.1 hemagglutinin [Cupriavidus sp. AcVe19-1a]MBP0639829.1 hemagglutinin [Cupriavidus sp. AcVe19-6a]